MSLTPSSILATGWPLWLSNMRQDGQIILNEVDCTKSIEYSSTRKHDYVNDRCLCPWFHQLRPHSSSEVVIRYFNIWAILHYIWIIIFNIFEDTNWCLENMTRWETIWPTTNNPSNLSPHPQPTCPKSNIFTLKKKISTADSSPIFSSKTNCILKWILPAIQLSITCAPITHHTSLFICRL